MAAYATTPAYTAASSSTSISSPPGGWANPRASSARTPRTNVFPHIQDIIASARLSSVQNASLTQYLSDAESRVRVSQNSSDFGRPDLAYREYLVAFTIAVEIIPKHKDFGFWVDNQKAWAAKYKNLRHALMQMSSQIEGIRTIIEENNVAYGTLPQSPQRPATANGSVSLADRATVGVEHRQPNHSDSSAPAQDSLPAALRIEKARPPSQPKPEALQGAPIGTTNDALSQRFARLRMPGSNIESGRILTMPKPSDFGAANPNPTQRSRPNSLTNGLDSLRPLGPREMPGSAAPAIPPKIPQFNPMSLPEAPKPTFDPVHAPAGDGNFNNATNHADNRPLTSKKQTYYYNQNGPISSIQLQNFQGDLNYRPKTPNGVNLAAVPRSTSSEIPHDPLIDASTLAEYVRNYKVLIVDIRERAAFDEGHIHSNSILCVEPISLREGVSADDLEERLVLSPEHEQSLFSQRNEFDVVVYYDQSTSNVEYLRGPPTHNAAPALRAFYDTLREFNESKPLKDGRPPVLLQGGLDAWIDLIGIHALVSSQTASLLGTTRQRPPAGSSWAGGRQRVVSSNSRYEVRNRRLAKSKFLDEKEQQAWLQQAQQEEVSVGEGNEPEPEAETFDEPESPYVADYETFLRKFPVLHEQQSMVLPSRKPVPPAPRYEAPAVPPIPTRPPPAIPRPSYSGHAELHQSQPVLARVESSTRPPLYSPGAAGRNRKLPRTGLVNFGVTCYMNSTLQCLSGTLKFVQFFREGHHRQWTQKNWKGSSGIMPQIFANVIDALWQDADSVIKPSTLRNFCGRMNREWLIDRQQDAKEYFDFLIDCLHEDLNKNWQKTPLKPLTISEESVRENMPVAKVSNIEWERWCHRDESFISSLFAGQHASRLRCISCGRTSTTYEAFYSISVEIPRSGQGDIVSCLKSYTKEERLSETWRCPHCKADREATKQIILTRLPEYLVIHFKRFSASKTETIRKIHTPIDFPIHTLSMDQFVIERPPPIPDHNGKIEAAVNAPYSYDAYAVLRHIGNSNDSGHYISIVKDQGRGCWRKFDDDKVSNIDPGRLSSRDRLQNGEAYIVFYQRVPLR